MVFLPCTESKQSDCLNYILFNFKINVNSAGSFLVVYVIFFSLGALPVFIMEITIGQYAQRGAMEIWNLCPLFKG